MKNSVSVALFVSALALMAAASSGRADCNVKDFIVEDVVSLQKSGGMQLAFVLTATESEYKAAKKNLDTGADVYGLFSGDLNYAQAQQRASQIATATKFNYESSYANSYLSQTVSGQALNAYVKCLEFDKQTPGLRLWLEETKGKYYTIKGFWVGAGTGKYDEPPVIDGGTLVGPPTSWRSGETQTFAVKSDSMDGFYLTMKVGGEGYVLVAVPNPPDVIWLKQPVVSSKKLSVASTFSNPCSEGQVSDSIYPLHSGGHFVANTRTVNHSTNDPSHYSEKFTVDSPDQVSVTLTQNTGDCNRRGVASGQLEAIETYPQAAP